MQPEIITKLRSPYSEEIAGIARATGIPKGEILLFNIFYEVFTVCTSIVGQDEVGETLLQYLFQFLFQFINWVMFSSRKYVPRQKPRFWTFHGVSNSMNVFKRTQKFLMYLNCCFIKRVVLLGLYSRLMLVVVQQTVLRAQFGSKFCSFGLIIIIIFLIVLDGI